MFTKPAEQSVELVDLLERVIARIRAHANTDRSRRKRDHPDPIALAEQMFGAVLAKPWFAYATHPLRILPTPVLDVETAAQPEPSRIDVMTTIGSKAQLALQQRRAPGRVDHPACRRRRILTKMRECDLVVTSS